MGLHLTQLIKMCCCKGKNEPVRQLKTPKTLVGRLKFLYHTFLGPDGLFGRRGKYYNWRLVLREVVEIPAQTYQGYMMSSLVPYTIFPTIYGCTTALDCILVPVILLSPRLSPMTRQNGVIMLDIVVDIVLGAILPFSLLIPTVWLLAQDPTVKFDLNWAAMSLNATRQIVVTSPLDLFITALPLVFSHLMMKSVHNTWLDAQEQKHTIKDGIPVKTSRKQFVRTFGSIWSFLWGFFILSEALRASNTNRCGYNDVCKLQVYPWFVYDSSRCDCLVIHFNCEANPTLNENTFKLIEEAATQEIGQNSLYLTVDGCQLESIPQQVAEMSNLFLLKLHKVKFESFDLDLSSHESLYVLVLAEAGLKILPETLQYLPKCLRGLYIIESDVKVLPD